MDVFLKIHKSFSLDILVQYQFQYHALPIVEPNTKYLNQVVFNYSALIFPQWQQYITDFCDYRLNGSYVI